MKLYMADETKPASAPSEGDKAAVAKLEADKQVSAKVEAVKAHAKSELDGLRKSITLPPLDVKKEKESDLLKTAAEKVGEHTLSFTRDSAKAFFDGISTKASEAFKDETDAAKKEKLVGVYAYSVSKNFVEAFEKDYFFLFADSVAGDIAFDVKVDKAGGVKIVPKEPEKVKAAKEAVEARAKQEVESANLPEEIGRFQKEHPEAFLFLKQVIFKDDGEMKEAFAGKGFLGFCLGVLGYGGGKAIYGSIMKMDWFSKYHDSALDSLAKLHPSLDFRKPIELEKNEDLNEYYNNLPKEESRFVSEKFVARSEITLPAMTTFRYIVFPKGSDKVSFPGMLKKGAEVRSLARDERHENITVPAGTKLEAGTVFSDIEIRDKAKIEAAEKGEVAPAVVPVASAVAVAATPAASPAPATAPVPFVAPAAPAPATAPSSPTVAPVPDKEKPKDDD